MAKKEHISATPATQFLRKHQVVFSEHPYAYEEKGGTAVSARELGVDEHSLRVSRKGMDICVTLVSMPCRRSSMMFTPNAIALDRVTYFGPWFFSNKRANERQLERGHR